VAAHASTILVHLAQPPLLGDLGCEQVADDALRLVLALDGDDDLVEGRVDPVDLELAHGGQNLGTLHHASLLRLS
jgi:hypothetical protein